MLACKKVLDLGWVCMRPSVLAWQLELEFVLACKKVLDLGWACMRASVLAWQLVLVLAC